MSAAFAIGLGVGVVGSLGWILYAIEGARRAKAESAAELATTKATESERKADLLGRSLDLAKVQLAELLASESACRDPDAVAAHIDWVLSDIADAKAAVDRGPVPDDGGSADGPITGDLR